MNNNLLTFNTTTDPGSYLLITINSDMDLPTLYIDWIPGAAVLRWTSQATNAQLTSSTLITNTNWTAVAKTPVVSGDDLIVTSPAINTIEFYRLER